MTYHPPPSDAFRGLLPCPLSRQSCIHTRLRMISGRASSCVATQPTECWAPPAM